jgi:hypothetical protein
LADLADPFDYSTHENQVILAKQLVEHGADVKIVSTLRGQTPLHMACFAGNVTNLDFIEYLLKEGADPNAQDDLGKTPLLETIPYGPGAAEFLLNWPTIDANITSRSGASFLSMVRWIIKPSVSDGIAHALPEDPSQIKHQFLLQQWREIEEMLLEIGALDTGITTIE